MECLIEECIRGLLSKGERKMSLLETGNSTNIEKTHEHAHMNKSLEK